MVHGTILAASVRVLVSFISFVHSSIATCPKQESTSLLDWGRHLPCGFSGCSHPARQKSSATGWAACRRRRRSCGSSCWRCGEENKPPTFVLEKHRCMSYSSICIIVFFPLLVLKGIYHYWFCFSRGLKQMQVLAGLAVLHVRFDRHNIARC